MNDNGPKTNSERATQQEMISLLQAVHRYEYLGNLHDQDNGNIMEEQLRQQLTHKMGCSGNQAVKAITQLNEAARCYRYQDLYSANQKTYELLRYGCNMEQEGSKQKVQKHYIDWEHPERNTFAVAEEVTVKTVGDEVAHRRPDMVIYVNGIALVVIELKREGVSAHDGIRQNIRNQEDGEIVSFFSTAQILMAGNGSEGLYYGTIKTSEKFYVKWKEPVGKPCDPSKYGEEEFGELGASLLQMLEPKRLLWFIRYCVAFDGGIKKLARPNQFFALQQAMKSIAKRQGGIIWHSQGSGKSLTMIWLAQLIKETQENARVVIITDRNELDKQIANNFNRSGEEAKRALSGAGLIQMLGEGKPAIICTLIHKFGLREKKSASGESLKVQIPLYKLLEDLANRLPENFKVQGNVYVFVDECHRTQGGYLNKAMKRIMGENAILIGFTGTPLLKADKKTITSRENFGEYIHTYTFKDAKKDHVVLDLRYESRNVEQEISDKEELDTLFEKITENLTTNACTKLQNRWAQMQKVYSSKERIDRVVKDILKDMMLLPPLEKGYGNAMLVADGIYQAFRYWDAFQKTELADHCAAIVSYEPQLSLADGYTGDKKTEEEFKYATCKRMIGDLPVSQYEDKMKSLFVNEPASMKLLIVVDKLLTGFDAPSATYLYIDKEMKDHNLFQAICRVNRVNGDNKEVGYIIDYKNLFQSIENTINDYTQGAFKDFDREDVEGLLADRTSNAKKDLDSALNVCATMSEDVEQPKNIDSYFDYFCYPSATDPEEQEEVMARNSGRRERFYDAVATLTRRYAEAAMQMDELGYSREEQERIHQCVKAYDETRRAILLRSGDYVDMKLYDAQMRSLLDLYIEAPRSVKLEDLGDFSFLDIIKMDGSGEDVEGVDEDAEQELGGKKGVAESMISNTRRVINRKRESNPEEYKKLSEKLNRLITEMKEKVIDYKQFLKKIKELCEEMRKQYADPWFDSDGKKALFDNLGHNLELAKRIYETVKRKAQANWRTVRMRRLLLKKEVARVLPSDYQLDVIMNIIEKNREF